MDFLTYWIVEKSKIMIKRTILNKLNFIFNFIELTKVSLFSSLVLTHQPDSMCRGSIPDLIWAQRDLFLLDKL